MLATEHNNELWLAPLVTSSWLSDGRTVSAVNVNGKSHHAFNGECETIAFPRGTAPITLRAEY
jgi:hypothetical protein